MTSPTLDVASCGTSRQNEEANHDNGCTQARPRVGNPPPSQGPLGNGIYGKLGHSATTDQVPASTRLELEDGTTPAAKPHVTFFPIPAIQRQDQEVQPKSGSTANVGEVFKNCRPTEKEEIRPQTDDCENIAMEDFYDGYQDVFPVPPYPGDNSDRHFRESSVLFEPEDLSDVDADQECHDLKTAETTGFSRKSQGSASISGSSRANLGTGFAMHAKDSPITVDNEGMSR
jgi:hypothetical protein